MSEHRLITVRAADGYPLRCRYRQAVGARALVVLLHGVVSHSGWLEAVTEGLAASGISSIAADRRGAGLNEAMRGDAPDGATLLSDLSAVLLRARDTELPCHLCGFCWGANYAVNYMGSDERSRLDLNIRTLSLLAPSLFPTARITERPFLTGDSSAPTEEPTMPIECFTDGPELERFIEPDPLRLTGVSPRLNGIMSEFSRGIWMKFLRLETPTLVVLGANDEVVDNAATERLFGRLKCERKSLRVLPSMHGLQFDAPAATTRLVVQWVSSPPGHRDVPSTGV